MSCKKLSENFLAVHEHALLCSQNYKKSEANLLEAIIAVRDKKIYRHFGYASLYEYCLQILKLDAGVVYAFTAVAKKAVEVPELKSQIASGILNVSTARRITSVITSENKNEWFEKAAALPIRKLEREVARVNPKEEVKERASYLNSKRVHLEVGLEEGVMLKLRRIQDLESQRQRRSVSLEEAMAVMIDLYLAKNDPVQKAKRAEIRGRTSEANAEGKKVEQKAEMTTPHSNMKLSTWQISEGTVSKRSPVPAHNLHKVFLRDKGKCQHINNQQSQKICGRQRFIEIHHVKPVGEGGGHEPNNLKTLCYEHHRALHE